MRLNKGIYNPVSFGICIRNPKTFGICIKNPVSFGIMNQESGFKGPKGTSGDQESGFRHLGSKCSIIENFTVSLFIFFEKKKYWNIGTFRSIFLKSLKYKNKIDVFCSKTFQYARTYVYQHFFTFRILKT